jgi:anaerobic selenocysteine-containing dehydrogenase
MSEEKDTVQKSDEPESSRRNFLKLGLAGAGVAAVAATGGTIVKRMEGQKTE